MKFFPNLVTGSFLPKSIGYCCDLRRLTYLPGKSLGGKMRLGGLLQQLSGSGKSERLVMRGPGGRGALDVAVSTVPGIIISAFLYVCSCRLYTTWDCIETC